MKTAIVVRIVEKIVWRIFKVNPIEEIRSDLISFQILKNFGYDYMVRGLKIKIHEHDKHLTEIDLIGVNKNEEMFDCFEFKVGTDPSSRNKSNRRKKIKEQIMVRGDPGIFRKIYVGWDWNEKFQINGYGTLYVNSNVTSPIIHNAFVTLKNNAPEREVNTSAYGYRHLRKIVRQFNDLNSSNVIFLSCPKCEKPQFFYPFQHPHANNYSLNKSQEHAWYCHKQFNQYKTIYTTYTAAQFIVNGQYAGSQSNLIGYTLE